MAADLRFHRISKSFGAVHALRDVSVTIQEGETHALVGENGAGKSTLMKILAGIVQPDAGHIEWDGRVLALDSPRAALDAGIGMVYQDLLLCPNLTIAQNIFLGREIAGPSGWLNDVEMRNRTRRLIAELHAPLTPDQEAGGLSAAHKQLLQIARAVAFECRILILDEPTTSLTDTETAHLFETLGRLRRQGVTLIYVSHRLPEVFRLCNQITVLRDGQHVGTFDPSSSSPDAIIRAMIGRDLPPSAAVSKQISTSAPRLQVRGITRRPCFEDVSLSVAPGEIVGVFGLVGSGRSELLETIFGLYAADAGTILLDGRPVRFDSSLEAVRAGLALVPEERHSQGLFYNLDLRHNLLLTRERARGMRWIAPGVETSTAQRMLTEWRIRAPGVQINPDALSGGNQQKLLLARWLATQPRLLMLDEPTKGVDVGAKWEIHAMIREQAQAGMACLVVSSELPEILALADRVVVLREGRLRGELTAAMATEEAIMRLAAHDES